MAWTVELTARVSRDLDRLFQHIHATESLGAAMWFDRLENTIALLATSPRLGRPTREDPSVRELIYGNKPHFYRVLYELDDSSHRVYVLTIRHGKRLRSSS